MTEGTAGRPGGATGAHEDSDFPLAGISALIVEDEPLIGMSLEAALSDAGAKVCWVPTDDAAYRKLSAAGLFNLLIADINLGQGTTGFDVARYARRLDPLLPVIHLSGESPNSVESFGVSGAVFLAKPVVERELMRTAAELIKGTRTLLCSAEPAR
jgi:DNA-binding response OmpR family regulator